MVQTVFGGCCIPAAGRGPSPALYVCMYVGVTKVLLASEYLFLMTREKYVEKQHGHKIQIAMTRSLFCYKVNQVLPFCL